MRTLSLFLLPALCLSSFSSLCAQTKAAPADKYAAESFVIERTDWVYSENADGTGWAEHTVAIKLQSDAALREFSVVSIAFASASQHVEFKYVRARHADGTLTETPGSDVIEQPTEVTQQAPFYSDLKEAQLPVKNLRVGDTLEWQARIVRTRAEAPDEFWGAENFLSEDAVTLEETIELRTPAAKRVIVWTNPALPLPLTSAEGQEKVWRWKSAQLAPTTGAEAEAAKKARKGKLLSAEDELDAEQGKRTSVAWSTFQSWEEVGAWYRKLEASRIVPDEEIKAKAAELVTGKTTDEERVRAIYAYVSARIRYIGVAFGVGRYQPHEAADVLHSQYGDCKDKETLLASLLSAEGIPSDAVLIGAGIRFNEAVPSPGAFNHLITHLTLGGKEVWLDATAEVAPYGMLSLPIRGVKALVVPPSGPAKIETTPQDPPFPSSDVWTAKGAIDKDGISQSHIQLTMRGDDELAFRMALQQVPPAKYEEFMQQLAKSIGFIGETSHASFTRPDDTATPMTMEFDYRRERGDAWKDHQLLPQMEPMSLPGVDEKDPPVSSILLGVPRTETSHAEMKIPAGWTAELPEAIHAQSAWATYDMTYRVDQGNVVVDRKIVVSAKKVPASEWKAYKKFTDAISLGTEWYVILHAPGQSQASASSADSSAKLKDLYVEAEQAYNEKNLKDLETIVKKMRSVDPHGRRVLAWEGTVALAHNKPQEALDDNRKELAAYPDETDRYQTILYIQSKQKDEKGALATLREWMRADTQDPKPALALSAALSFQGDNAGATEAAAQAVARTREGSKENEAARLQLGRMQIKAGMLEPGRATMVALMKESDDPGTLNDAAYDLADAKLELALDEVSAQKAVAKLTAETADWTLDEKAETLKARTSLLLASWDTLGWVFYREGKFKEAQPYLEAAKLGRPDATVVGHGEKEQAALAEAGASTADPDQGKTELELRTFALGPSNGKRGTAEYRLLLGHGRVERAEPAGDEKIEGAEAMLHAAKLGRLFPPGSDAKLAKTGMVNCVNGQCELVLEP